MSKEETQQARKAALIVMEYLIHHQVRGFSHKEISRFISNLAKLDGVLESKKMLREWTEKNILRGEIE